MLSDHCLSVPGKRISRDGDGDADFGNFHNYYAFNKVSERLDRLQESGCLGQIAHHHLSTGRDRPLTFLDVGCNEGRVTEGFLKALKHHSSVDDPCAVIALGVDIDSELVKRAQRLQAPLPPDQQHFICLNIMSTEQQKELDRFLCGVAQQRFTMVLALSVTMWIHIHHGDVGLKDFLHLLCERSEFLIVEPQPWKCYISFFALVSRSGLFSL